MKILTCSTSIESAMKLRDAISAITGRHFWVTKNPNKIDGKFIRYGNSSPVRVEDTEFNSAEFIQLCANKRSFSEALQENFYVPKFHSAPTNVTFPCLIRHTLTSFDGRGIVVCKNRREFENNWRVGSFWTPFVKTQFELRVHVLGGKVVKIFKKEATCRELSLPIRNLRLGYHYSVRENALYPKVSALVKKLRSFLSGHFYTLDLGWDAEKKEYFIFEANTGSGLNENTANLYATYLVRKMEL